MSNLERIKNWIKNSVTLKIVVITILMLLLLIPQGMVNSIIHERELLSDQATREVSSKWAEAQLVNGPILTIPLIYKVVDETKKDSDISPITKYLRVLPASLNIEGDISPEILYRGIYKVIVYKSKLNISGTIKLPKYDETNLVEIQWDKSYMTIGISDLRGIAEEVIFNWGDKTLAVQSGSQIASIPSAITIPIDDPILDHDSPTPFSVQLDLHGSGSLQFIPTGSVSKVYVNSDWGNPSFNGNFLPDKREVSDLGFSAEWKVLQLNRNFPESWIGNTYFEKMKNSALGLNLKSNIGNYGKASRSAKYGAMIIALTFLIFFLAEVLYGNIIHPFQYILIGLSLSLFFVLLVALSEHMTFLTAYTIGAGAIISLISLYSISVFKAKKMSIFLCFVLTLIYSFLYITLQSTDYALLIGSIGLTMILGLTMYFTRNIDWYSSKKTFPSE